MRKLLLQSMLKTVLFLAFVFSVDVSAQTVFSENMGTASGTLAISANTFQNSGLTFTGTADTRSTGASSGYTGASGGRNVFITNTVDTYFEISGINTTGYTNLTLTFGEFKSLATGTNGLVVEVSSDGTNYTPLTYTRSSASAWVLISPTGTIPATANLRIRFRQTESGSSGNQWRVDDVKLTGTIPAAAVPGVPLVNNPQISSLDVTIDATAQNGNGATVQYAIQETTTGNYVQANGTLGATAVWQTAATWGTVAVTGLNSNTQYTFRLKARNVALVETSFGGTASGTTLDNSSPFVSLDTPLDAFGAVCTNASATGGFTFDGANLNGSDIVVNSLSGYSYSLTQNGTYTSTLNIPHGSTIADQVVWVKFAPGAVQSYNGNIQLTGGGIAVPYNVAVSGSGINTAVLVTTGSASAVTAVQATAAGSLTQGCSSVTAYGIEYSTTSGFGSGTQVAAGNLAGGAFSSTLTGLAANTQYYYKAFATDATGTVYGTQQTFTTAGLTAPVASAATSVQQTQFTANWQPVDGATSYRLDVSTSPDFPTLQMATDLFISEYVEGSSSNKYIEIYNGTGASVNLSDYQLRLYANGGSSPLNNVTLSGTLVNGATIVYSNSGATVYGGATTDNAAVNFNGDDAVALFKISTGAFVDIIGSIGSDPGTQWTASGGYSTLDKTLVRNASVHGGVTTSPNSGFPTLATEWTVYDQDDVTHLGSHAMTVTQPEFVAGYENLTVNGTSQVVSGLTGGTDYYYRVRAVSANSTSGNSNVISVTTLQAQPSFGSISQNAGVVCDGSQATFTVTGLVPGITSTLTFNINGDTPVNVDVTADGSGAGTFNYTLAAANNGQVLTVTSVTREDAPGNPLAVATNNTVVLGVNAYVTYYRDFDNDTYGNPADSVSACDGAPAGYVTNNTDCDDNNNAANTVYPYYVDADGDGYGSTTVANVCAASPTVAPAGYSVNADDCNDDAASAHPGAVEIGYNLIDDDCDGSTDEGFPAKVTAVQGAACGNTLPAIDTQIVANIVAGAQGYRWRVTTLTGPTAGQEQTLDTALRVMKLTQLVNYAFDTQYKIEVAVYYAGFLQPYNVSACNVTTPAATTQLSTCGQTLTNLQNVIYANIVPFAQGYRFRITDPVNAGNTQVIERVVREFRMNLITNFTVQYNKTYNVEVSVKNTDGTWLPYGAICNVTTPAFPTTSLQDSQCDDYNVPTNSTQIYAVSYPGAIAYVFQITGPGIVTPLEVTKSVRTFTVNDFPSLIPGATYSVKVRLVFNFADQPGPYGKTCTIVTPGASRPVAAKAGFDVVASPNPFADNFNITLSSGASDDVTVKIYDMTGRLIDNMIFKASDSASFAAGQSYPSGVYNVIVTQGDNTKALRLVKR